MLPRPRFKLPLWTAVVIIAGAFLVRGVLRGMDFRLEWPADAAALGLFAAVLLMVAYVRNVIAREDTDKPDHKPSSDTENTEGPPAP